MPLNNTLITQFAKSTKTKNKGKEEVTLYGVVKTMSITDTSTTAYVQIDGSDDKTLLPVSQCTTEVTYGDRVVVMIKNHTPVITGNMTAQSVGSNYVNNAIQNQTVNSIDSDYIQSLWDDYNN